MGYSNVIYTFGNLDGKRHNIYTRLIYIFDANIHIIYTSLFYRILFLMKKKTYHLYNYVLKR